MKPALFRLWKRHLPFLAFAAAVALVSLLEIGCPFRRAAGIPCPACGMTRAWLTLLHGDWRGAFFYHPLFPLAPLLLFFLFYGKKPLFGSRRREYAVLILLGSLFLLCYFYRLFFDPSRSIYA